MLTALPRYSWAEISSVPFRNGVYIVFEEGEIYHDMPRIVRVGTHTSPNRLRQRLKDHFVRENHSRSIFRENIGKALLNQKHDSYLPTWSLDTSKPPYSGMEDTVREREIELVVSDYLRNHITFSVFQVNIKEQRLRFEEGIISALHHTEDFAPSTLWLGQFSPESKICESGMWLKQGLDATPLTEAELCELEAMLVGTTLAPMLTENVVIAPTPKLTGNKNSTTDIRRYILNTLYQRQKQGDASCILVSGEIHKTMGLNNKMPSICSAIYQAMEPNDVVVHTTPSGKNSTIQICYQLNGRIFKRG